MRVPRYVYTLLLIVGAQLAGTTRADNWPAWRGPHGTGVAPAQNLPER